MMNHLLKITFLFLIGLSQQVLAVDVSFEDVQKNFRQKNSFDAIKKTVKEQQDYSYSAETRRLSEPPEFGIRSEINSKDSADQKYEFTIKQKINLGIDKDLIQKKNDAEFRAERLSRNKDFWESEHELAKLFSEIKLTQLLLFNAKRTLDIIGPYEGKTAAAASGGSLGGFFLARFQIFLENVKSDQKLYLEKLQALSKIFSNISGIPLSPDPLQDSFKPLSTRLTEIQIKDENYLPLQEATAKEQMLASEVSRLNGQRQVEIGIGMTVEKETQKNSYLMEFGVPLGLSLVNSSLTKSLDSARRLTSADVDLKRKIAAQQIMLLKSRQNFTQKNYLSATTKMQSFERLFEKAQKSFNRGNADIAEYIETLREFYESKIKQAETLKDYEEASYALFYFAPQET